MNKFIKKNFKDIEGINYLHIDTEKTLSDLKRWELSEVALRDKFGPVFNAYVKPSYNIHTEWTYPRVSKECLFEAGLEKNELIRILKYFIKNREVVAWNMDSEIELLPNVLSLAKQTYCAMKRFDPYRGVYNFRTGNYHYTKLSDALNLIGKDFYGKGPHNAVSDCWACKEMWDWMNQNPITGIITGGQHAQKK